MEILKELNTISAAVRILLSIICAGALGHERMRKMRVAGLRTFMLVGIGSSVAMMTGIYLSMTTEGHADAGRIPAQVVSGISFIGAGTIILTGSSKIKGLTTASLLWASATIGLACGAGLYAPAIIATLFAFICMRVGGVYQRNLLQKNGRIRIFILLDSEEEFKNLILFTKEKNMRIVEFESNKLIGDCTSFSIIFDLPAGMPHADAVRLVSETGLTFYTEEN